MDKLYKIVAEKMFSLQPKEKIEPKKDIEEKPKKSLLASISIK